MGRDNNRGLSKIINELLFLEFGLMDYLFPVLSSKIAFIRWARDF